jgi:hypothetical protein
MTASCAKGSFPTSGNSRSSMATSTLLVSEAREGGREGEREFG